MGIDIDIERGMAYEAEVFGLCFTTHDQKEGMTAFIERRNPKFLGK
jgi:enoyl-CoA hydratase